MKRISWIIWIAFLFLVALSIIGDANANTQNNESGSNTLITGGTTGMTTTTNNDYTSATVDNSTTNNSTSNVRSAPPTASAPGLSSGIDTCSLSVSAGVQTFNFGISGGSTYTDENCEKRKNAKLLSDLGMKVAAIALMCEDEDVWIAMWHSATYCPVNLNGVSLIGEKALAVYLKYPELMKGDFYEKTQMILQKHKENEVQYSTGR